MKSVDPSVISHDMYEAGAPRVLKLGVGLVSNAGKRRPILSAPEEDDSYGLV